MFLCFLFGLAVLGMVFLIPLGGKLFTNPTWKTRYKYILLSAYLGGVLWLTLVNRFGMEISRARFEPFYVVRQILNCWFGFKKISAATCRAVFNNSAHLLDSVHVSPVEDLFLNIILFIPFGFLLPYLWPRLNFYKTLLIGFLTSCLIEGTQYLAQWGCLDIDDIFNDTLGVCIGYTCWTVYNRLTHQKK